MALREDRVSWLRAMRRYFAVILLGNLVWEFLQFPLYTLWWNGSAKEIIFAALHCTGGDLLITGAAFLISLILLGNHQWPHRRFTGVASLAIVTGFGYTIFSEWLNTEIRGSWVYTEYMPTLPIIGSGLAPLAQWLIIPAAAFWWARLAIKDTSR